jgi:hypothetical protein
MVNAIARMRYFRNVTQDGRPSNSQVQRSMYYYGYGKPEQRRDGETRGTWYDQNGDVRSYGAALAWVKGTALRNKYTFTMLLSIKDVRLAPEAFVTAMRLSQPPFSQWRLIAHDDTAYAHAHVIAFSNRILPKREVVGWSSRARDVLEEMRHEQIQQLDQTKELHGAASEQTTQIPEATFDLTA